jgi:hypothetical protein
MNFEKIRKLYDISDNTYGIDERLLVDCEKRLGVQLPLVLKQYYLELGNHDGLNQSQNNLVLPNALVFDSEGYMRFYIENQGNIAWFIKYSDAHFNDPSVYALYDDEWVIESSKLSDFLLAAAYLQAIFVFPYNANKIEITEKEAGNIPRIWQKIPHFLKMWNVEFYQNTTDEILAFFKSEHEISLFIAAKTPNKFKEINAQLNINWDYNSEDDY